MKKWAITVSFASWKWSLYTPNQPTKNFKGLFLHISKERQGVIWLSILQEKENLLSCICWSKTINFTVQISSGWSSSDSNPFKHFSSKNFCIKPMHVLYTCLSILKTYESYRYPTVWWYCRDHEGLGVSRK